MFEKEIKFIADFNLNKIKSLGSFITFDKILNSDVHPAVLQYISAELDFLINEDRRKLLQQSVFDYSGQEVAKYFSLIAQEVKKTKKISYEDIKKLVIQAVSFNINYLIRPNWSLTKIIFNEAGSKSAEEINLIFNYVYYYDYIKNIFNSYLSKRKLVVLNLNEFELILNKIDKELFESQPQKLIENALISIAEFSNLGSGHKTKISPNALENYLKEKNQIDYLFRLRRNFPIDAKQRIEITDITKVLFSSAPDERQTTLFEEETIDHKETSLLDETEIEEITQEENQLEIQPETEQKVEKELEKENDEINLEEPHDEELPSEEIVNINVDTGIKETDEKDEVKFEIDEELLDMYEKELESNTENSEEELSENKEQTSSDTSKSEDLESLYDFEEETKDILKDFTDSIDEVNIHEEKPEDEVDEKPLSSDEKLNEEILNEKSFDEILNEESQIPAEDELKLDIDKLAEDDILQSSLPKPSIKRGKDFFEFISDREIEKVVSSVFNDDREDFANTMERLTECNNYEEATEILKSVFLTYRVNPYSRDAIILTNSVSNYFSQD